MAKMINFVELREAKGLTLEQAAEQMGLGVDTLRDIELANKNSTRGGIQKVITFYGLDPAHAKGYMKWRGEKVEAAMPAAIAEIKALVEELEKNFWEKKDAEILASFSEYNGEYIEDFTPKAKEETPAVPEAEAQETDALFDGNDL